ncbi:MAG: hypothetical protein KDA98_07625 [Acidimicrobiales bacterium]|nr:hypothetical protein [Acidimicrobiales bacterium]
MEITVNRAYDLLDNRRHALALRSRTFCGLARAHVRSTTLAFDPDDFFACSGCVAVAEGAPRAIGPLATVR